MGEAGDAEVHRHEAVLRVLEEGRRVDRHVRVDRHDLSQGGRHGCRLRADGALRGRMSADGTSVGVIASVASSPIPQLTPLVYPMNYQLQLPLMFTLPTITSYTISSYNSTPCPPNSLPHVYLMRFS